MAHPTRPNRKSSSFAAAGAGRLLAQLAVCGGLLTCAGEAREPPPDPLGARIEAHVRELGSDRFGGRAPGTPGGEMAADYIEEQLRSLGLEPAGTDGFRQPVPLLGVRTLPSTRLIVSPSGAAGRSAKPPGSAGASAGASGLPGASAEASGSGVTPHREVDDDEYMAGWNRPTESSKIQGEAVFVGYGVVAGDRDDLAGADLEGKWAVALAGEPPELAGSLSDASYQPVSKLYAAHRRGAVGLVFLSHEATWPAPYDLARETRVLPGWGPGETGQPVPWMAARGELVEAFGGGKNLWEEALAPDFRARPLGVSLRLELEQEVRRFSSPNLLARLPGADPRLAPRHVCLSAHYDGLGRTEERVYNGVIDNAVAVGELLEAAALAREEDPARRSLLFFFPTAEEAGLVGSRYFVENPTVPLDEIVGCLNKDGAPEAWGRSGDVVAIASEASPPFGAVLRSGVARLGLAWSPNPFPAEGFFFRSDHYSFLQAGVPGVLLYLGLAFEGREPAWGVEQAALYLKDHYHRPSDDLSRVLTWEGPAQYTRLWLALARQIADGEELARGRIELGPGD